MIYYLASWYSVSVSSRTGSGLCASPVTRGNRVVHTLTSPLSLRVDSHSENLTGWPEAGARE